MRLFVAIELPESVKSELVRLQTRLERDFARSIKPTRSEQLHITLKFLGEIEPNDLDRAKTIVTKACAGIAPFTVSIGTGGTFPPSGKPRVCWIGITEGSETIISLASRLDSGCEALGVVREGRDFTPHITLARCAERPDPKITEAVQRMKVPSLEFQVSSIDLYESIQSTGSHRHDIIYTCPLSGSLIHFAS